MCNGAVSISLKIAQSSEQSDRIGDSVRFYWNGIAPICYSHEPQTKPCVRNIMMANSVPMDGGKILQLKFWNELSNHANCTIQAQPLGLLRFAAEPGGKFALTIVLITETNMKRRKGIHQYQEMELDCVPGCFGKWELQPSKKSPYKPASDSSKRGLCTQWKCWVCFLLLNLILCSHLQHKACRLPAMTQDSVRAYCCDQQGSIGVVVGGITKMNAYAQQGCSLSRAATWAFTNMFQYTINHRLNNVQYYLTLSFLCTVVRSWLQHWLLKITRCTLVCI